MFDRLFAFSRGVHEMQRPRDTDVESVLCDVELREPLAVDRHALARLLDAAELVEKQVEPVLSGAAETWRAPRSEPERRVRRLNWRRLGDDVVVVPVLAGVAPPTCARPSLAQDVQRLVVSL